MTKTRVTLALDDDALALLKENDVSERKQGEAVSAAIRAYYAPPPPVSLPAGIQERIEAKLDQLIQLLAAK